MAAHIFKSLRNNPANTIQKVDLSVRLETVDALRGIASFSVAWFHFTNGNVGFLPNGLLKQSGMYGWLGVEVFFVISGFIIPYSLYRSGYKVRAFHRFTAKRLMRLDPPYFVNIAIVLVLGYLSTKIPGFRGQPFEFSGYRLALHFGYLNAFVGEPWINPVYWTLAIEFQYYLLIGLLFPILTSKRSHLALGVLAVSVSIAVVAKPSGLIFNYALLFSMGIIVFRYKVDMIQLRSLLLGLLGIGVASFFQLGALITIAGLLTALTIGFCQINNKVLAYFGLISYSLYLIHVPIGGRIVNLGQRYNFALPGQLLTLFAAIIGALGAASIFYHVVEKPAQQWASTVRLRQKAPQQAQIVVG